MLDKFSNKVAVMLLNFGSIEKEKKIIYVYGTKVLTLNIISFLSALFVGIILNEHVPTIIFLITFIFLRRSTGRFHAKKYYQYFITTNTITIIAILFYKYIEMPLWLYILLYILSFTILFVFVPIENINKPIDEKTKKIKNKMFCNRNRILNCKFNNILYW